MAEFILATAWKSVCHKCSVTFSISIRFWWFLRRLKAVTESFQTAQNTSKTDRYWSGYREFLANVFPPRKCVYLDGSITRMSGGIDIGHGLEKLLPEMLCNIFNIDPFLLILRRLKYSENRWRSITWGKVFEKNSISSPLFRYVSVLDETGTDRKLSLSAVDRYRSR